ncbi:hypothetical protein RC54_03995 [Herbaspirillum rubrisubalbicans]|uniref:Uncharacterized protein n=1 Tax=Herbaspirillum rubrisubalbicans TaxID=80842 RepID=A0AAD0XEF9_9BURK|nr:hypothetical protein RC54_03995 [Herbaspirillum rubrisubalbicans]
MACGEQKPISMFYRRPNRPCGTVSQCKACKAIKAAAYRAANLSACKDRSLAWYRDNKEHSIKTTREWQEENKERVLKKRREWLAKRKGI